MYHAVTKGVVDELKLTVAMKAKNLVAEKIIEETTALRTAKDANLWRHYHEGFKQLGNLASQGGSEAGINLLMRQVGKYYSKADNGTTDDRVFLYLGLGSEIQSPR